MCPNDTEAVWSPVWLRVYLTNHQDCNSVYHAHNLLAEQHDLDLAKLCVKL